MITLGLIIAVDDLHYLDQWLDNHNQIGDEILIWIDYQGHPEDVLDENFQEKYKELLNGHMRVMSHALNNDFAAQRNNVLEMATNPWVLMVDSDEIIPPDFQRTLPEIVKYAEENGCEAIGFPRYNVFHGKIDAYPDHQFRLMRNTVRYVNNTPYRGASPGCHETPDSRSSAVVNYHILHIHDNGGGSFRLKGYTNDDQQYYKNPQKPS